MEYHSEVKKAEVDEATDVVVAAAHVGPFPPPHRQLAPSTRNGPEEGHVVPPGLPQTPPLADTAACYRISPIGEQT